jgi:DMATS type aromatic prenyltransferase
MDTNEDLPIAAHTFESYATARISELTRVLGFGPDDAARAVDVVRRMTGPWGRWTIDAKPHWRSDACADGSPLEFSMAIDGGAPELRFLVESLSTTRSLAGMQEAARALTRELEAAYGLATDRLRTVEDLFFPKDPKGLTAMMHAVILRPGRAPDFKIYLNPMAHGIDRAPEVLKEALARFGFARAWRSVEQFARRGFDYDRIVYLSLDLLATSHARVKVYVRQYEATAAEIDEVMTVAPRHVTGQVESFCTDVSGHAGVFDKQALGTCLTYRAEDDERPTDATFYVPLWTYASNDEVTRLRIREALARRGLPTATYEAGLRAVARRPLEIANGIHTYCSMKLVDGRPRITVYWSPELYSSRPPECYQRDAEESAAPVA